jgi:molybdopterin-guanine dinucleotide biosynthesis protein A
MLGVILAGGQARRMGGGDKPLLALGGRSLLAHVVARVGPQVEGLAISANGDPARFAGFGVPVVADAVAGQGPLGGMLAGLRWAAGLGAPSLLVAPGDTPFLPDDLVLRLEAARAAAGEQVAYARCGGLAHPAVAVVATRLVGALEGALAAGQRGMLGWMEAQGACVADWDPLGGDQFLNINTPEELRAARARWDRRTG